MCPIIVRRRARRHVWRRAAAALVALLALGPTSAESQGTLTFGSSLNNPVASGNYVGPYAGASFLNAVGQSQVISVICVDFLNHVAFGDRYTVSLNNLGGSDDLAESRHPGAMLTYRKAAWLGSLFGARPQSAWGSVHHAIWNLFTPAEAPEYGSSNEYLALADRAAASGFAAFDDGGVHYDAVDMTNYWVLTDVAAAGRAVGGRQEFIAILPPPSVTSLVAVPEPGTLALVVSGALGVVGLVLRERRDQRRRDALRPGIAPLGL